MSRQLEQAQEERTARRQLALYKALDFALEGAINSTGVELLGFAMKWDAYSALMTLKGVVGGDKMVAFIGSDSPANCVLKAVSAAQHDRLRWKPDKWANDNA